MSVLEREMREWRNEMEEWRKERSSLLQGWTEEKNNMHEKIASLEEKVVHQDSIIQKLQGELLEAKNGRLEEGEFQPSVMEELNTIKEQVRVITQEEEKKSSWVEVITMTQKKVEEAEKWIEVAKKGKDKEAASTPTSTPTIINMTLEEEQRRRIRALHVRVTGLKDANDIDKEVTSLMSMMGMEKPLHTKAWRVGKRSETRGESSKEGESSKDRALILRFPSLEDKKEFLKKRPTLKKTGIFLGDDLTLSQLAHMKEVMPEIRAAREKGKLAFYRDGRVVIVQRHST